MENQEAKDGVIKRILGIVQQAHQESNPRMKKHYENLAEQLRQANDIPKEDIDIHLPKNT